MELGEAPKDTSNVNNEKKNIVKDFQDIFSDFQKETLDQPPLTKQDIIALFNTKGAYGKALRDNQNKAHFKEGNDTKINLERVYNYIIETCSMKDPHFAQTIKEYEKTIAISSQFVGQNLYYRKIMVLNTYLVEQYGLFFSFATDHMALTPDPIVAADKKQVPQDWQEKIQTIVRDLGFDTGNNTIYFILVHGNVPHTTIQAMYIANHIFVFESSTTLSAEDLYARIANEYLHASFEQRYGEKILLRDVIQNHGKNYFMGLIIDGIFPDISWYSVTGHTSQEFLSDVAEMQISGGKNQIDLWHKVYNLKERKVCREQYRNTTRLMTYLINNEPTLATIYDEYKKVLQDSDNQTADIFLLKSLQSTKIQKDGKEISGTGYISFVYSQKASEMMKVLDKFVKTKQ